MIVSTTGPGNDQGRVERIVLVATFWRAFQNRQKSRAKITGIVHAIGRIEQNNRPLDYIGQCKNVYISKSCFQFFTFAISMQKLTFDKTSLE